MSDPPADYDRVVIGAGIIGSCTAYQLLKAGHRRVLLIDQFPLPHSRGSSHGQSRIIRTAYGDVEQANMARRTRLLWRDLEQSAGETLCVDCPLLLVAAASHRDEFNTYVSCISNQTIYQGDQLARLLPAAAFPDGYTGGLDDSAGLLRADRCLLAVRRLFVSNGGIIRDGTPVTAITPVEGTAGEILRLEGPSVTCRGLVVCAGAWAARLLSPLGLPRLVSTLRPEKVAVTYWKVKPGYTVPLAGIDLTGVGQQNGHFYWLPALEYPGLVKLCYHVGVPCDPDRRDTVRMDGVLQTTKEYVARTFPGLEPEPAIVETCMYTVTPDERCILDVHPRYPNIAYAAGMSGQGFKMGPVFAEVLQQLVDGQKSQFDLTTFSAERFSADVSHL
ncbi:peroxisomal sarcosine oxidase-like [Amphibalanus amphitrite]|uniref:peroxisomal sarcosine oxidase-like n=1 Tax=Amphibalanus amphitrite TaxID=1232801 RepID=UPI001C928A32|nr:peroxisomal sarcosine oxidase-like [Amphibalanus amphitrite]